jgi:hypothetical protein
MEGKGLSAALAKAASDPNPVVMFTLRLLAPATVADDRIAFPNRTSPQQDLLAVARPIGFDLAWRGESGIKRIVVHRGLAPALTCQDLSRKQRPSS